MKETNSTQIPKDVYKFFKENHKCINCGNCCHCTPMMITGKDIKVMSCYLNLSVKEFKKQYTKQYPNILGISCFKQENPCIFLDKNNNSNTCKIYDARPDTCRKYPFSNKHKLPDNCPQIMNLFNELIIDGKISNESLSKAEHERNRRNNIT